MCLKRKCQYRQFLKDILEAKGKGRKLLELAGSKGWGPIMIRNSVLIGKTNTKKLEKDSILALGDSTTLTDSHVHRFVKFMTITG